MDEALHRLLERMATVRIGFVGDLCVDVYWMADMTRSHLSLETPHHPLPVVEERIGLGAGGNVLANLVALGPASIRAVGLLGDDWRGFLVRQELDRLGISRDRVFEERGRSTPAYCKPVRSGLSGVRYEDPRIDFAGTPVGRRLSAWLAEAVESLFGQVDVLCVCDQFPQGLVTPALRQRINHLAERGMRVVVDSRDHVHLYRHGIAKPNEREFRGACRRLGIRAPEIGDAMIQFRERTDCQAIVTRGALGCLLEAWPGHVVQVPPGPDPDGPVDVCGAGDAFLAAFACAVSTGASLSDAALVGNLAASVAVGKIGTTGSASPGEILDKYRLMAT